jgi:hypothetical protein
MCKNIDKFFQKFEVGHIQTSTPLESNIKWIPKGGHFSVLFHPLGFIFNMCL